MTGDFKASPPEPSITFGGQDFILSVKLGGLIKK
jgi:hypothetical protein